MTLNSPSYQVVNLGVDFIVGREKKSILSELNFTVGKGEFLSICGPSGTGKTTLLRALCGLVATTPGSLVRYAEDEVTSPPEGVVLVFQNYSASLLPWRSVARNVALGLEGKVPRAEMNERISRALELVGLAGSKKDYPWRLSGGMQQRVQIARALAVRPDVLLMDEPFGALDAMTKSAMQDELQRLRDATNATVVFVTHDIEEAVYLSDRVLVINGTPATITHEIGVDLPRPRDQITTKESDEYLKLRHKVHQAIHAVAP
ncbi:ABC transporter ATP-binding protein [Saxibacter everestensis]|uniref:ABC transporter ATP-binding protein n=1 Tax=Saxibacter everestensis TaxID=2909229 RepID=A0ABY8QTF2_9MICO|nr:ABC transporter ATP-binding protein [Brevibacteriaceae bacterium ZFBP1038]